MSAFGEKKEQDAIFQEFRGKEFILEAAEIAIYLQTSATSLSLHLLDVLSGVCEMQRPC